MNDNNVIERYQMIGILALINTVILSIGGDQVSDLSEGDNISVLACKEQVEDVRSVGLTPNKRFNIYSKSYLESNFNDYGIKYFGDESAAFDLALLIKLPEGTMPPDLRPEQEAEIEKTGDFMVIDDFIDPNTEEITLDPDQGLDSLPKLSTEVKEIIEEFSEDAKKFGKKDKKAKAN